MKCLNDVVAFQNLRFHAQAKHIGHYLDTAHVPCEGKTTGVYFLRSYGPCCVVPPASYAVDCLKVLLSRWVSTLLYPRHEFSRIAAILHHRTYQVASARRIS